jgi:hypothetical protein
MGRRAKPALPLLFRYYQVQTARGSSAHGHDILLAVAASIPTIKGITTF